MSLSIVSDRIRVLMEHTDTRLHMMLADDESTEIWTAGSGSALQNPDLSRAQLAALLRGGARKEAQKANKTCWNALIENCASRSANSND